jgi:hypothetical protein
MSCRYYVTPEKLNGHSLLKTCNLKMKTPERPLDFIVVLVAFEGVKLCHVYQMF